MLAITASDIPEDFDDGSLDPGCENLCGARREIDTNLEWEIEE